MNIKGFLIYNAPVILPVNPGGRAVKGVGLRPVTYWDCGFESRRGHGYLSLVVLSGRDLCDGPFTHREEQGRI